MSTAMDTLLAYADAFEETLKDDDWSRLEPYFPETAVYEIVGGPFACQLEGRRAIFAGLKKSLDGLIPTMRDEYTDKDTAAFAQWMVQHNMPIDASYV